MMPQKSLLFAETCYLSKKKKYYLDEWLKDFPSQWSGQEKGKIVCSRVTYLEFFRSGELLVVPRITMRDNKRNYVADTWWFVLCCVSFFSRSTSYIHEVRFNDTVCIYAYDISALRSRARARAQTLRPRDILAATFARVSPVSRWLAAKFRPFRRRVLARLSFVPRYPSFLRRNKERL